MIQRRGPEGFIVRICALASGSSGNSTFVATERTRLLVDAGLSFKDTCNRMLAIGELYERTQGWPAGLRLAAILLRDRPDHESVLAALATGSHEFIRDYLLDETLAGQSPDARRRASHASCGTTARR